MQSCTQTFPIFIRTAWCQWKPLDRPMTYGKICWSVIPQISRKPFSSTLPMAYWCECIIKEAGGSDRQNDIFLKTYRKTEQRYTNSTRVLWSNIFTLRFSIVVSFSWSCFTSFSSLLIRKENTSHMENVPTELSLHFKGLLWAKRTKLKKTCSSASLFVE